MPQHGWVKNVREDKGFCFITDASGLDRFVHVTQLFGIEIEHLLPGEEVTFEPDDDAIQCRACGQRYHGGANIAICQHLNRQTGRPCGSTHFGDAGPRAINVWTLRVPNVQKERGSNGEA